MFKVALAVSVVGWSLLALMFMNGLRADMETTCTANRGEAYRSCIRGDDEGALGMQALALGLAVMAMVIVVAGSVRQRLPVRRDPVALMALVTSGLLLAVSISGWVLGAQGLWAPDRPYPYDLIATSDGHAAMLAGAVFGLLAGAFVVHRRTSSRRGNAPSA